MATRLAIAHHKGGVAKSTTAMMIAEGLAHFAGYRVLIFDFDPQSSLSAMMLSDQGAGQAQVKGRTLWHLIKAISQGRPIQLAQYITPMASDISELRNATDNRRVDLVASHSALLSDYPGFEDEVRRRHNGVRADVAIATAMEAELDRQDRNYEVIIFDCPAGAVPLSLAALRLCQMVISPTTLDDISLRALRDFLSIILKEDLGVYGHLKALKVLATMVVSSNPEQRQRLEHLRGGLTKLDAFHYAIGHSVAVQRATTRLRSDSYRTAREKYDTALIDVRELSLLVSRTIQRTAKVTT